jgi:hypothetical protein
MHADDVAVLKVYSAGGQKVIHVPNGRGEELRRYDALRRHLHEAVAAVEETNRVVGLSRLVEQVRGSGQTTLAVMEQYQRNASGQDADACVEHQRPKS